MGRADNSQTLDMLQWLSASMFCHDEKCEYFLNMVYDCFLIINLNPFVACFSSASHVMRLYVWYCGLALLYLTQKKPCGLYIVVVVNVFKNTMYSTCIKLAFVRGKQGKKSINRSIIFLSNWEYEHINREWSKKLIWSWPSVHALMNKYLLKTFLFLCLLWSFKCLISYIMKYESGLKVRIWFHCILRGCSRKREKWCKVQFNIHEQVLLNSSYQRTNSRSIQWFLFLAITWSHPSILMPLHLNFFFSFSFVYCRLYSAGCSHD